MYLVPLNLNGEGDGIAHSEIFVVTNSLTLRSVLIGTKDNMQNQYTVGKEPLSAKI